MHRSAVAEISGSLGDLGTLLPLMIALAARGYVDLGSTLVFSGLFNMLTGAVFGIPLPVQPMKAIASAAISGRDGHDAMSLGVVVAAGQWVGLAVLVLSVTGLLSVIVRIVPIPVVKGIQLGAGLSLVLGAGSSLLQPLHWTRPLLDNRLWAALAFAVLVATQRLARFPYALVFFVLALALAGFRADYLPALNVWHPRFTSPSWLGGPALSMAIAQLPLTTLNSIVAVSQLSADLLPDLPAPSVTSMGLSVALMNLTGTWFGAMPVCHGAGGLAAQYRFGARSGASVVILGAFKLVLGLVFGDALVGLLRYYPNALLGIMVFAAGLELAKVGNDLNNGAPDLWQVAAANQDGNHEHVLLREHRHVSHQERLERWTVMLTTAGGILAFRNDAAGFLAGMLCHSAYMLSDKFYGWRATSSSAEQRPLL
ncbi:Sulfate transporter family [Geosmithia morbida]|uniref:Sulfate transporter family n=1 Tax=Geosmithia morbida TaxID=1094350 RepID=A0A9P4YSQ8_9HYPO|nr:Sulfate transporter family [Geosmithia morbida]KAF4121033.1 Sulfate transporter family [Geosmithia morbida]